MRSLFRALVLLFVVAAVVLGAAAYELSRRGLSTRVEPSRVEEIAARAMRRLATPSAVRSATNPVPAGNEALTEGMEHFADHCAVCHANDGSGETEIGRGLYPPAPDMRAGATQNLTDGELFSIIENGIRLTGMPGWGDGSAETQRASWAMVHFIRHLPRLTDEEVARMEALNPKTAAQWREEEDARRFLAGDDAVAPAGAHGHE